MIIATKRNNVETENAIESSGKMHVNTGGQAHLIRLLTKAYSDKIGSIVRESTANAKDSHIMANQEAPVIVRIIQEQNGEYSFEVEDRGLGLNDVEFAKYIMGIGESTKQLISNVLGGFGIGSKAASSYHDDGSYYYTCRKEGIERKYMIYAGEEIPDSTLIYSKPTTESNGVIVTIPIKDGDKYEFLQKIKEQLCYFSGVYFENCNIENNFKIYRNDLFQWSEISTDGNLHISLDDVYYPIDYQKLGIKTISFHVALRFKLEDALITPIPNRENIEYTKETKKAIIDKIKELADWFVNKYNEDKKEFKDYEEIYWYFNNSDRYLKIHEKDFLLRPLLEYTSIQLVQPSFPEIKTLNLKTIYNSFNKFLNCFEIKSSISYGKYTTKIYSSNTVINKLRNTETVIVYKTAPSKKIIEFIKDTYKHVYFVKKEHDFYLGKYSNLNSWKNGIYSFVNILNLKEYPKSKWRDVINDYLKVVKHYENQLIPLESIQITKEWEDKKKASRKANSSERIQKLEGEINFKFAEPMEKYSDNWNCKFVSKILKLKDFHKRKQLVVYGLEEQRKKLDDLFVIGKENKNKKYEYQVQVCIVGQRDYEKLKNVKMHNLMKIEDFENSYNKPIARFVTAYKISEFVDKYKDIFRITTFLKDINLNFTTALQELNDYQSKYKNEDNDLMKSLISYCEKNNYYDQPMWNTFQEISKNIDKLDFIKFFIDKNRYSYHASIPKEATPIIQELLKARKFRMDWKNYVTLQEKVKVEEEELIEQD
jgi:hypothetical protein